MVESLVAALLLAIAASAALTLFTSSEASFRKARQKDSDQIAINEDLARIERLNRRFVCINGSCDFIADGNPDPTELQYTPPYPEGTYPPGADFNAKMGAFRDICASAEPGPSELADAFTNKAQTKLGGPLLVNGIRREFNIIAASQETPPTPHAYVVIYSRNGVVLRRARLVPTVVSWCP